MAKAKKKAIDESLEEAPEISPEELEKILREVGVDEGIISYVKPQDESKQAHPLEVEVAGQKVIASTPEELQQKINEILARQQQTPQPQMTPPPPPPPPSPPPQSHQLHEVEEEILPMDAETFEKLAREKGLPYAVKEAMRRAYGGRDPMVLLRALADEMVRTKVEMASQLFLQRHPEYIPSPENNQIINQVLVQHQLNPANIAHLEFAYEFARQKGWIRTAQPQSQASPQSQPQSPLPEFSPTLGPKSGGGIATPDLDEVLARMLQSGKISTEQYRALIENLEQVNKR